MFWGFNAWNFTTLFPHHLDYYRDVEGTKYSGLGINYDSYYPRPYSDTSQDLKINKFKLDICRMEHICD